MVISFFGRQFVTFFHGNVGHALGSVCLLLLSLVFLVKGIEFAFPLSPSKVINHGCFTQLACGKVC